MLIRGLKRRPEGAKGNWVEELSHVIWDYNTIPQSTTIETPFLLTYNIEAVILVEVEDLSWRTTKFFPVEDNGKAILEEIYLL